MLAPLPEPLAGERTLRVQIVEDERIVALDLQSCLEQLGFKVVGIASKVHDALRMAGEQRPDLVLMDIHLDEGGDGISAARQIRDLFALPVVFLTAFGEPEILARAAASTPYGFVLKPFELREMNATLRMAIVRRQEERRTESAQRRLQLALESARLSVLELDDDSGIMKWSGQALDGELARLAQAQDLPQMLAGLDEEVRAAFDRLMQRGEQVDMVCRWQESEAAPPRWLELHARYFAMEHRVMCLVRDVSARVESEMRLRQALVAFDTTDEAILFLDREQRVLGCNRAFRALTGWTEEAIVGQPPEGFLYDRRLGVLPAGGLAPRDNEIVCRSAEGRRIPALRNLRAVQDERGDISHYVLSLVDLSEIRATQLQLRHQARHDALTGLANRAQLHEMLQERCAHPGSAGFALLLIDLDGFKTLNETLGHDRGDALLITLAERLRRLLRREDLAGRLGGDEFAVLMHEPRRIEDAMQMAEKLLDAVRQPVLLDGEPVSLTASIGVVLYPEHGSGPHALLKAADAALYEAKGRGRDRAALFHRAQTEGAAQHLLLEQGLRRALGQGELSLLWQPMTDMRDGRLLGAEALLRWQHPTLGAVSPTRFIPLAEATGLICPIGAWVLDQACAQAAAWLAAGRGLTRVAVNISVRQFEQQDMLHLVRQALERHRLPPERLEIEVTESLFGSTEMMQRVLGGLRDLGVAVSLDDFGTGFSSLGQLKTLPIDRLKIDRSFVADLADWAEGEHGKSAIVRTIVTLAQDLGLEITAEGVETQAQRDALLALGAHEAQGWFYYRAMTAEAMTALLPLPSAAA